MVQDVNIADIWQPMIDGTTKDVNDVINAGFVPNAEPIGLYVVLIFLVIFILGVLIHFFVKWFFR